MFLEKCLLMQHLRDQILKLEKRAFKLKESQTKRDLYKMILNVESMIDDLSRETVECRRLNSLQRTNRATPKYESLLKEIEDSIYRMEKYLTLYSLLDI